MLKKKSRYFTVVVLIFASSAEILPMEMEDISREPFWSPVGHEGREDVAVRGCISGQDM